MEWTGSICAPSPSIVSAIVNVMHALAHVTPTLAVSDVHCSGGCCGSYDDARCTYRIAWSLNQHTRVGAADPGRAASQHRAFVATLQASGAQILRLPFVHGAYDCVFPKDNAVLLERGGHRRALLARPRHAERRAEQSLRREALECHGFHVMEPPGFAFEGGDVVVLPGVQGAFLGHGERSTRAASESVARFLDAPVVPLALRDPRFFHLDLALSVLSDGTALVCPEAFGEGESDALTAIERTAGVTRIVIVPLEDALSFALNLVEVGEWVVVGGESEAVNRALRATGQRAVFAPLDEFQYAGGSAACLVSQVHVARGPHAASKSTRSPTTAIRSTSR